MKGIKLAFGGWSMVSWFALIIGIMLVAIWLVHGFNEQGMRIAVRATARTSCILFLSAFVASALGKIWFTPFTAWLLKNRRYLGLSFAISHTYHAIAWSSLWFVTSGAAPKFDVGGAFGYALLIAMTLTSFQGSVAWLGQRNWKVLHTVGMYFFWLAFTLEFSLRISKSMVIYLPIVCLLILAILLRLVALRMQKEVAQELVVLN